MEPHKEYTAGKEPKMTFSRNKKGKTIYFPTEENSLDGECAHIHLITTGGEWDLPGHILGSAQTVDCLRCGSSRVMHDSYWPGKDPNCIRRIDYNVEKTVVYGLDGSTQVVYLKKGHEGEEF